MLTLSVCFLELPSFAKTLGRKKKRRETEESDAEESDEDSQEFVVGGSLDLSPERWTKRNKSKGKGKTLLKQFSVSSGLSAMSSATDDKQKTEKKEKEKQEKKPKGMRKNFGLTLGRKRKTEPEPSGGGLMMSEFFQSSGEEEKDGEFNFCFSRTASFQDYEGFDEEDDEEREFNVSDESSQSIQTEILYEDGTLKHEYESSAATHDQEKKRLTRSKKYNQETLSSSVSTAKEHVELENGSGRSTKEREQIELSSGEVARKVQSEKVLKKEVVIEEGEDEESRVMEEFSEMGPGNGRTTFKLNERPVGTTPEELKRLFGSREREGDEEDFPLNRTTFKQTGEVPQPKGELTRLFESTTEGPIRTGPSGSVLLKEKIGHSGGGDAEDAELKRLFESTNEGSKRPSSRENNSFLLRPTSTQQSKQLENHVPRKGRRKSQAKRENLEGMFGSIVTKKSDDSEGKPKPGDAKSEGVRDTGSTSKEGGESRVLGSVTFTNEVNLNKPRDSKAKPIVRLKHQRAVQSGTSTKTASTGEDVEERVVQSLILMEPRDTRSAIERDLKGARNEGSVKTRGNLSRVSEQQRLSQTFARKSDAAGARPVQNKELDDLFNSTIVPRKSGGPVGTGHVAESYKNSGVRLQEDKGEDERVNPSDMYEDQGLLGEGSFGEVRRMRDRKTGQTVAAKICTLDRFETKLSNLKYEVELLSSFREYPYIVRFMKFLLSYKHELWIVTEVCEGGDVFTLMREITGKGLEEPQISAIMASCLLALETLHSKNIIHRDVKGANVLLSMDGLAKLSDLGVSKRTTRALHNADRRQLNNGTQVGSLHWMAPELANQEPYNFQVDIWSLGITCIECAEAYPPHRNLSDDEVSEKIKTKPTQGLSNPEDFSKAMNNFISRCLTIDPYIRPTAKALYSDPFVKQQIQDIQSLTKQGYFNLEKGPQRVAKRLAHIASNPETKDTTDIAFERTVLQVRGLITDNMKGLNDLRNRHKVKHKRWVKNKQRKQSNF